MAAIAPPPIAPSPDEAHDAELALGSLRSRSGISRDARGSRSRRGGGLELALFGAVSVAAALGGALLTRRRRNMAWYRLLRKPKLTPPDRVFALVWPVLYSLGALSAWRVALAPRSKERTAALGLWGAQIAFNAAWTPLFFGAHRPRLAMADLVANGAALGAYALTASKVDRGAAAMVLPYLGWVTFAGILNASIIDMNRGRLARLIVRG